MSFSTSEFDGLLVVVFVGLLDRVCACRSALLLESLCWTIFWACPLSSLVALFVGLAP